MLETVKREDAALSIPFDAARLDQLMDDAGLDIVVANSKHNIQYLLGGHRSNFFDVMDAMAVSRYLPLLVYPKGAPDKAAYIGHRSEASQHRNTPFWTPEVRTKSSGTVDAMRMAIDHIRALGPAPRRIGVELGFLPMDAGLMLSGAFPDSELTEALYVLERLRTIKTAGELEKLRIASDLVIDSMLAVIAAHGPGSSKQEIADALRREETARGLVFEYCLIAAGSSHNRIPSPQAWEMGEPLSLDSGANYHGYIGDVARMAILGEPDAELEDILAEIEAIQRAGMKAIRAGAPGGDIHAAAEPLVRKSKHREYMEFLAHGMGLVTHEPPRLTNRPPLPYTDEDARRPLEAGMVVSVETTLMHPSRGFIKLEDTVAVTETGHVVYGDRARGWTRGGTALAA